MTPQELKASILQLAIQGKLVEQRPEEGSGGELLERIFAAKNAKDAKGAKKSSRAETPRRRGKADAALSCEEIPDSEKPFDIPESWVWVRLGELLKVIGGVSYDKKDVCNSGLRILRGGNIQNMEILLDDADVFLPEQYRDDEKIVRVGDILIVASTGSKTVIGKAGYIDKPIPQTMIGAFLRICRPSSLEFVGYLRIIFESDFYRKHIRELSQGTNINNIKEAYITQFAIPLPPLAEQKRIVAKIEELLPYIDRYEKAWSKLEDFNKRFPGDMQKSLLQMAIQGKLVDQRPEEGTGEELYRQIQTEKQRLVKSGKIKKEKPLPEITPYEIPFDIPESWKWVRLGKIVNKLFAGGDKPADFVVKADAEHMIPVIANGITNDGILGYTSKATANARTITVAGRGTIGFSLYREYEYCPVVRLIVIEQSNGIVPHYLELVLHALPEKSLGTSIPQLTVPMLYPKLIPLPPLAEQKRIVAKLEELLPLCERLK